MPKLSRTCTVVSFCTLFSSALVSTLLTGCTLQTSAIPDPVQGTAISGVVHGGQQAISNAHVYLLAVNNTGYGGPGIPASPSNASISLLTSTVPGSNSDGIGYYVTTNANGGFSVSGDYSCTSGFTQTAGTGSSTSSSVTLPGNEQVYLYVLGGTASIDATVANSSIGLLAALGPCNSPTTKITLNEITTVGTAYAFAGLASDATHISTSGSSLAITGLNNAFSNVANLVNVATGSVATATAGGNGTIPAATITSIANILAACVNSNGGSISPCTTIFPFMQASGSSGGLPTDTATATINLAHNPYPSAYGVATLFGVIPAIGAPFSGSLSRAPNDFTLTIAYSGGSLVTPQSLAVDKSGDVWIANLGNSTVAETSPTGTYLQSGYTGKGITAPTSLAFDQLGTLWVGYAGGINQITPGSTLSAVNYTPPGSSNTTSVAVDGSVHILYTSAVGAVGVIDDGGYLQSYLTPPQLQGTPTSIAPDGNNNMWVGLASGELAQFADYPSYWGYTAQIPTVNNVSSIGLNAISSVIAASSIQTYSIFNYSQLSSSTYFFTNAAATTSPTSVAIDGEGNTWVAAQGNSISEFDYNGNNLSGSGFQGNGSYNGAYALAIDGSGNVWTVNSKANNLVEMIGAASPVVTPVSANLVGPYFSPDSQP